MKRKLSLSLLAILLIISIVSCDGGIVGLMGKMGENVLGTDTAAVTEKVASSITVSEEDKTEKKTEQIEEPATPSVDDLSLFIFTPTTNEGSGESTTSETKDGKTTTTTTKTETDSDGKTTTTTTKEEKDSAGKTVTTTKTTTNSDGTATIEKTDADGNTTKINVTTTTETGTDNETITNIVQKDESGKEISSTKVTVKEEDGKKTATFEVTETKTTGTTQTMGYKDKETNEEKSLFSIKKTETKTVKSTSTVTQTTTTEEGGTTKVSTSTSEKTTTEEGTPTKETKVEILGVEVELKNDKVEKLEKIESVLPPADVSEINSVLQGNGSEEAKKQLSETVTDETTKKAAEGTATLVSVLLEQSTESSSDTPEVVKTINSNISEALNKNSDTELTNGDVVALKALTNVLTKMPSSVVDSMTGNTKKDTESSGAGSGSTGSTGTEGQGSSQEKTDSSSSTSSSSSNIMDQMDAATKKEVETAVSILNNVKDTSTVFKGVDISSLTNMLTSTNN